MRLFQRCNIKLFDFLIFILIFVTGLFFTFKFTVRKSVKGSPIVVVSARNQRYEYSAGKDGVYSVQGVLGKTTFEIKDGQVRIIDSPCNNKICIQQGCKVPLVCLPNDVIITMENQAEQGEYDAVAE